jgi:Protein of unknown function (DUF2628)
MAVYTVHQPPIRGDDPAPVPERFAFVRDGFSFWAFLFGPLWMLRHRMWLVLAIYVALATLLQGGLHLVGAALAVRVVIGLLIAVLVGLEAATLRRVTLARRRWREVGVIVADDREAAERRFFAGWTETGAGLPRERAAAAAPRPRADTAPEVIGLFPEAGAPR